MSLSQALSAKTYSSIRQQFNLREVHDADGGPYMTLVAPMSPAPVGEMRVWVGDRVQTMVYIGVVVPFIGLDSHMIFAFTPPDSAIPHFTLDSVKVETHYAFHVDLVPRVELAANLAYTNAVLQPLTADFAAIKQLEGLSSADVSPRQYSLMSPWMLAYRATEDCFRNIDPFVARYVNQWSQLVANGLPAEVQADLFTADLAERDLRNRAGIFHREVDPNWGQIDRLLGEEKANKMMSVLRGLVTVTG